MGSQKIPNAFSDTRTAIIQRNFDSLKLSAVPGGANTAIQFNNSGSFSGENFYWNNTTNVDVIEGVQTGKNIGFRLNRTDGANGIMVAGINNFFIGSQSNHDVRIIVKDVARITILPSSGYVGLSVNNPIYPLHMSNGAYCSAGGVWTNASSVEYKDEISDVPLEDCLEILKSLRPVYFRYVNSDERHAGFIAEELHHKIATKDKKGVSPVDILAIIVPILKHILEKIEG